MSARDVAVFLGPSLGAKEAKRLLPGARVLPPARQGDVFRVLPSRPKVLVLIDGVFEGVPSVWHHELRAALACGVHVLGAASMGALRAAELHEEGLLPVGVIAGDYVSGRRTDDADVALLHGDAESGYRPMTVPLVNVEATAAQAVRRKVFSASEGRALARLARAQFYKSRTWRSLVQAMPRWSEDRRQAVVAWLRANAVDLKAQDARRALSVAATLRARPPRPARVVALSSFVRRRRLLDAHGEVLAGLERLPDADALAKQGLRRLLLASFAKAAGLTVPPGPEAGRGLAVDEALADAEVLALEALVLSAPERFVGDGPSWLEGLALEARLTGRWPRR